MKKVGYISLASHSPPTPPISCKFHGFHIIVSDSRDYSSVSPGDSSVGKHVGDSTPKSEGSLEQQEGGYLPGVRCSVLCPVTIQ